MSDKKDLTNKARERRSILKLMGLTSAASLVPAPFGLIPQARSQAAGQKGILVVYFRGGYSGIWSSADSFVNRNFGVTSTNVVDMGNDLFLDRGFYQGLIGNNEASESATMISQGIASVGVRHGITSHGGARRSLFKVNNANPVLPIGAAMGGSSAIKAANVGGNFPPGDRSAAGISLQGVNDLQATIDALSGTGGPDRGIMKKGLEAAHNMSASAIAANPLSLGTLNEGYLTGSDALGKITNPIDANEILSAYGLNGTTVNSFEAKMAATELMIRSGTNIVTAIESGPWDNHGDRDHSRVRNRMYNGILPPLRTFLARNIVRPELDLTVVLMGDFARTTPGSGHAPALSATVIGKSVGVGTTGVLSASATLPSGTPNVSSFWALIAQLGGASSMVNAMGGNPHRALVKG